MMNMETLSEQRCHAGVLGLYRHQAQSCAAAMRFAVYQPPQALAGASCPVLLCLAGLTCTEETFLTKSGVIAHAAAQGLVLIAPDTSPRETGIAGEADDWEFGTAASFYLDASEAPWSAHFRMESWLLDELLPLVARAMPAADVQRLGITGHSMGGHGALTLALKHPQRFRSVSAFAPICAPSAVPWGQKALPRYLGADPAAWARHDAVALIAAGARPPGPLLVDQGLADRFLQVQLQPERLEEACRAYEVPLQLRQHPGYDHSYWFIQSFIADHVRHHAAALQSS